MHSEDLFYCRVCGFRLEDPPWGYDSKSPVFDFCPCCGVEFGYQDATPEGARKFRYRWLERGATWDDEQEKPEKWNLEDQIKQIPMQYK
jgi:hypothetical protein